jgi:hypothetical protein
MRRLVLTAFGFSIGTFICLPAMAATTVEVVQGQVSVNQGQGYKQVTAASAVSAGDQVMAAPGGRGKIVFADGCALDVYPGAVLTVPEKCYQPMRAGLEEVPVQAARPWIIPAALATGVVVVGACAVADCISDDDHHRRRQPKEKERTDDGGDNDD